MKYKSGRSLLSAFVYGRPFLSTANVPELLEKSKLINTLIDNILWLRTDLFPNFCQNADCDALNRVIDTNILESKIAMTAFQTELN